MAFGHNSNVTIAGDTYHVQTEERGAAQALIDTTVYLQGRVLHRRTNSFLDLLPLNPDREQALRLRVDTQHRGVVDEIRSGKLRLKENRQVPLTDGHKVDYDRAWQLLLDNVRVGPGDVSTEGEFECEQPSICA